MTSFFLQHALPQYLAQHYAAYLEEWRIRSTPSNNHDMEGTSWLEQALLTCLQQRAISTRLLKHDLSVAPILYAEIDAQAPYSLCFCVPRTSAQQQLGTLITSLAALAAYRNSVASLPINVKWVLSSTAIGTLEKAPLGTRVDYGALLQADGYLWDGSAWLDPEYLETPLLALGCKGQLSVELTVQSAPTALSARYGAIVPNAAWRLTWALASLKDAREDILIDGFYDTLIPTEDEEIALLSALPDDTDTLVQRLGLKHLLMNLRGFQQYYARLLTPACTVTSVQSSEVALEPTSLERAIPATASAHVDFQLVPEQDPDDIFAKLRRHLDAQGFADVHARLVYAQVPVKTSLQHPFVQLMRQATRVAYGREAVVLPLIQGIHPFGAVSATQAPHVIFTTGYGEKEAYSPQPQQFLTAVTQLALLLERIQSAYYATTTTE